MWNSPFPFFTGPLSYWGMTLFSDSIPVWFGVHLLPPPVPGREGCGHQPGSQVLRYSAFSVTLLPTSLNHSQRSFFLPLPLPSSLSLTHLCSFAYWLENLVSHSGYGSTAPWAIPQGLDMLTHWNWIDAPNPTLSRVRGCHLADPRWGIRTLTWSYWRGVRRKQKRLLAPDGDRAGLMTFLSFLCPYRWHMGPAGREGWGRG